MEDEWAEAEAAWEAECAKLDATALPPAGTTGGANGVQFQFRPAHLKGLSSRPELNGRCVAVVGMDSTTGRYRVLLDEEKIVQQGALSDEGATISVRPENLQFVDAQTAAAALRAVRAAGGAATDPAQKDARTERPSSASPSKPALPAWVWPLIRSLCIVLFSVGVGVYYALEAASEPSS